jgi:WD40 repeat protein
MLRTLHYHNITNNKEQKHKTITMATNRSSSAALHQIDCSDQPLDLSFHPTRNHIVAAALVDGTVEVHDFDEVIAIASNQHEPRQGTLQRGKHNDNSDDNDDDDDEQDTIVSSTAVHTQILPSKRTEDGTKKATCRAVHFSLNGGQTLFTGGSAGDLVGLDATRLITFSNNNNKNSSNNSPLQWRVPLAAVGKTGIQVVHEFRQQQQEQSEEGTSAASVLQPHLLVTGDEGGGVRIWDTRLVSKSYSNTGDTNNSSNKLNNNTNKNKPAGCVQSWKVHEDYVSGLENSADGHTLLSSSADCTMAVYDLRMSSSSSQQQQHHNNTNKAAATAVAGVRQSDDLEDELLSIQIMKHGRKVVCGTGQGVLSLFSWGVWGDVSDRFPGHPASIDALLKVDEDTLLTGSSDGMIRVVQIQPDKLIGILGDDHDGGFPIEKLAFNANRDFVGSVTHDNFIRIWDARILKEDDDDDDDDNDDADKEERLEGVGDFRVLDATAMAVEMSSARPRNDNNNNNNNSDDEWSDMDEGDEEMQDNDDDGDDDESDDSDSDDSNNHQRPKRGGKNENRQKRFQSDNDKFFQDL